MPMMKVIPIHGIWGANVGVLVSSSSLKNNNDKLAMMQEIIDNCVSLWGASMISVVFGNSLSTAECCDFSSIISECIKRTSQDCYTSLRVSSRNAVKIPVMMTTSDNTHNNNHSPTSSLISATTTSISSPLGCTVNFFVPKLKVQAVNNAIRKQILSADE